MKSQIDSRTQWDVGSAAIYLYHHGVAHMKRSSSPSLSQCLVDSATAVEKEVARADDGSACPGCRTHGQARRHAALAVAKRGRVALGPGRSPSARVGDMREKSDPLVTLLSQLFTTRAVCSATCARPPHSTVSVDTRALLVRASDPQGYSRSVTLHGPTHERSGGCKALCAI